MDTIGYGRGISEIHESIVFPHELSTMQDVLLLSPFGFYRLEKFQMFNDPTQKINLSTNSAQCII